MIGTLNVEVGQGDTDQLDSMEISLLPEEPLKINRLIWIRLYATYTGENIYINGENKRKLSTPCLGRWGSIGGSFKAVVINNNK